MSKGEWKPKPFNLPHADSEFKKLMVEAILTRKKDPNKFIKPTK
jgi:hypothetical protein